MDLPEDTYLTHVSPSYDWCLGIDNNQQLWVWGSFGVIEDIMRGEDIYTEATKDKRMRQLKCFEGKGYKFLLAETQMRGGIVKVQTESGEQHLFLLVNKNQESNLEYMLYKKTEEDLEVDDDHDFEMGISFRREECNFNPLSMIGRNEAMAQPPSSRHKVNNPETEVDANTVVEPTEES